ncbi:MAG: hypothetical protein D6813_11180 [Calditrichaeota bacterium]|nr:MAG: hypothetical protein D6813_11180 [Calditrichota bacterium]
MKNLIRRLIELQNIDNELQALEAVKGDLPQQVEQLQRELNEYQEQLKTLEKEQEELKKARLHWEGEVKVLEQQLDKYQNQLYSVKTNREYDAISVEIDNTREKLDEVETKILEAMNRDEQLNPEIEAQKKKIEDLQKKLEMKEKELSDKVKETESEWKALEKRRSEIINQISKPVLFQYERIRKAKGGLAVVEVENYACKGCYAAIPPQRVLEIRSMDRLIVCESCGRILVHKDAQEAVAH